MSNNSYRILNLEKMKVLIFCLSNHQHKSKGLATEAVSWVVLIHHTNSWSNRLSPVRERIRMELHTVAVGSANTRQIFAE
jgi:hypothetical protein